MKLVRKRRFPIAILINTLLIFLISGATWADSPTTNGGLFEEYWNRFFLEETKALVRIPTYRQEGHQVDIHLKYVQALLKNWATTFNDQELTNLKLRSFEWNSDELEDGVQQQNPRPYRVFGFRLGNGDRKISLMTHIDVVPPGNSDWKPPFKPFELQQTKRNYQPSEDNELADVQRLWGKQDFLVGRGTIDDKGPTVAIFTVLRTLAKQFDSKPEALNGVTLELLFDTSEETDMSTLKYLRHLKETDKDSNKIPKLGIVFDGMWCVRAEKGIERPVFSVERDLTKINHGLWINSLLTGENGNNPTNQIPDTATAVIKADSINKLPTCEKITSCYEGACSWVPKDEDPYTQAPLKCDKKDNQVTLTTEVIGVQHGSGPNENRDNGANPLVSLTNFLAYLAYELPNNNRLKLADNDFAKMTQFIRWGWGTLVFGEKHPDLLERHDDVFKKGNGTTYAITKFQPKKDNIELGIDIRYAINHHINGEWDGKQGFLPGKISKFGQQGDACRKGADTVDNDCIFKALVSKFKDDTGTPVQVKETSTAAPPDIRDPDKSDEFKKINKAFKDVMNQDCPKLAIGGGTDAKGNLQLWAAGALFDTKMGPPINFHGQNEGAPIEHLKTSAKILYRLMYNEINERP